MKSSRCFLAFMYLHIVLSICLPIGIIIILNSDVQWSQGPSTLFFVYLFFIAVMFVTGIVCVICGIITYKKQEYNKLRCALKELKLYSIPFYIINFIYSVIIWSLLVFSTRGIFLVLTPIPVIITCSLVFLSGVIGWLYIYSVNNKMNIIPNKIGLIHYFLQVISCFDIISTIIIFKKTKK